MVIRNCSFVIGSIMYAIICLLTSDPWSLRSTNSYVRKNSPFMQNKANFLDAQMNVSTVLTMNYEQLTMNYVQKNKANLLNAQMNVNKVLTKDYENISNWAIYENKANSNPIQTQSNPIYRGVASSEDGTCRGVASGEDGSEVKNAATRPYCRRRTLAYYTRIRGYFPDDDDLLRKT